MSTGFTNPIGLAATIPVNKGGSGDASFTAYAPLAGGTTTTAALQSLSSGMSNSGYVLASNGSSSPPTWRSPSGMSGSVVQVIYASTTSSVAGSGATYITTGLSATITPTSSSNHIIVMSSMNMYMHLASGSNRWGLKLYRGGSSIVDFGNGSEGGLDQGLGIINTGARIYYDAPATTSSITYEWFFNSSFIAINQNNEVSNMILMEVAL